jgi:hypothetical protein
MLLDSKIEIKISGPTIGYYKKIGYDTFVGDILNIPIEHLQLKSNIKVRISCDICLSETIVQYNAYNRYLSVSPDNKYRCLLCNRERRSNTMLERYGNKCYSKTDKFKTDRKNTIKERYGVDHYNKLELFKNKIKETNIERYGVESPMKNTDIKKKQQETIIKKYGFKCALQNIDIQKKSLDSMNLRYGVSFSMQNENSKNKIINNSLKTKANKFLLTDSNILEIDYINNLYIVRCDFCDGIYKITPHMYGARKKYNTTICTICNEVNSNISGKETQLVSMIKNIYDGEIILNSRSLISPFELDIYLPELKIAFEFNGLYWHSELYKENDYHKIKSDMCESNKIQLIHIWEDDFLYKKEIIYSMLLNKLKLNTNKIFARKCSIREINDNKIIHNFLNNNHLQGFVGSSIKIGLFDRDELVSIMTFGKKRKIMNSISNNNEYELLRFCNKLNTSVVGAASRLFDFFIKKYSPHEIITYADRSHSNGGLYDKLGFLFLSKTLPNYHYIIGDRRKHRFQFRKDVLIKEGYDKNKSESQIMAERGINKIFNSGNNKYILKFDI